MSPTTPPRIRSRAALWSLLAAGALAACQSGATEPPPTPNVPTTPTAPAATPDPAPPPTPNPPTPPTPAPTPPASAPPASAPPAPAPTPPAPPAPAPVPPGSAVPSVLAGEWTAGNPETRITQRMRIEWFNGTPQYFIGRSYANWFVMTFHPDGRYEQLWYYKVGSGSCTAESWKVVQGTATFGEGTFALTATSGRWKYEDDCATRGDYDRPMTAADLAGERRDHLWRFDVNPNNGRTYLMIGYGTSYTGNLVQLMFERPQ